MDSNSIERLWEKFVEKQRRALIKGKRRYLHFDPRISFSNEILRDKNRFISEFNRKFKSKFKSQKSLFKRGFYPFIKVVSTTVRYKKDKTTKTRTKKIKERNLFFASHFDALRYSWYSTILEDYYENLLKKSSFGTSVLAYREFEPKRSNIDFAYEVFDKVASRESCTVLAFDLEGFFDNINHDVLYKNWQELLGIEEELPLDHYKIFRSLTNYQFVEKKTVDQLFPDLKAIGLSRLSICSEFEFREIIRATGLIKTNEGVKGFSKIENKGICQGSPISAILSNISMINFDRRLHTFLQKIGGEYFRYSDDILIVCPNKESSAVKDFLNYELGCSNLSLNKDKSEEFLFSKEGDKHICINTNKCQKGKLQYLGLEFDGKDSSIRSSSISKVHTKRKKAVKKTIRVAFGKHGKPNVIFKKKLLKRFTSQGKSNFITYARLAGVVKKYNPAIQGQYSRFNKLLSKDIKMELLRREELIRKKNVKLLEKVIKRLI